MATIQDALKAYQAGNFSIALTKAESAARTVSMKERGPLFMLLSNIHLKLGNRKPAAEWFVKAARIVPEKRAAFFRFAVGLYRDEGLNEAIADIASEAARALPEPDFLFELAVACKASGRLGDAGDVIAGLDFSRSAHFMLLNEFGSALGAPARFSAFLKQACKLKPDDAALMSLRFAVAASLCDFPAMEDFERLVRDPDTPLARGLLENELAYRRLLRNDDEQHQTLPSYDERALQIAGGEIPEERRSISPSGSKITIGYLSNDFCQHVTMRLFEEVMVLHDRDRFDIRLFSYTEDAKLDYQQNWPETLRDATVQVGHMSDEAAARIIDDAGVDILVDLKGYTQGARLGIVRRARTPIKATYLGFPGPVREADLDYAITDRIVTPDSSRPFYQEKLCRLPETYQSNGSRHRLRPSPVSRAELGLPENALVLGSFNTPDKLSPRVIRLWASILTRLPGAVLNMLCSDEAARENIRSAFKAEGVEASRMIFFAKESYARFLARIAAVDLALDTFPYNGHTTSSDVLWMGTPLVARKGRHFAGRVSESLLAATDVSELVAADDSAYCNLAVELAEDAAKRAAIRARLKANRLLQPLFDTDRFTRHLERAYEMMADRARNGLSADHLDVDPLPARTAPFEL